MRGTADLSEVQQELDVELPTEDCDTFGGLVFAELGTIPEAQHACGKLQAAILDAEAQYLDTEEEKKPAGDA